tara:strand:+ start:3507 stop:3968 length:462 start_codon:yes stop_codon:yes gene_type:complete
VNKFLIIFSFIFSMLLLSAEEEVKILRVIDGDTVSAESRGAEIKIRLSEIDAPEMDQPFGTNSKKCLSELIRENSSLRFKSDGQDNYGRSLGWLITDDKNLNYEMIKHGCAWVYDRYVINKTIYSFQNGARLKNLGLWKQNNPIAPWIWRRNN